MSTRRPEELTPESSRPALMGDPAGDTPLAEVDDHRADPTLIRWMLGLSVEERLEALQGFVDSVWELRHGTKA